MSRYPFRAQPKQPDTRAAEAALLRAVINEHRKFVEGEAELVAAKVDGLIDRHAKPLGRGGVDEICSRIWQNRDNPARRRLELRATKKPTTLMKYVEKIARATGAADDDMLLEVFRDTSLEREVTARQQGKGPEPQLEAFWTTLSNTLQALAAAIVRAEGLEAHLERLVALHGNYDLVTDTIQPSSYRLLCQPLANWNEHVDCFPPIPSVVLFVEPKSDTVERRLTVRDTGQVVPVRLTVLREVRLAIGPADNVLVPAALFEFRSVLQLIGLEGRLPIRRPWLYLDEDEVEVEVDGIWRTAEGPFDADDPGAMPEGYVAQPHVAELAGEMLVDGRLASWRFPAVLEAPLQFEHNYVVWRPVTAGTCRELLLRPFGAALGSFVPEPPEGRPDTFCPSGTLAEAIELALHVDGPEGLAGQMRAEAARMAAKVRSWHVERAGSAEAVHRALRAKWEQWT